MSNATVLNAITTVLPGRGVNEKLSLEIGARVEILQHKVLKCSGYGFVQHITGCGGLGYSAPAIATATATVRR
jgi:hypothetical protein